MGDKSYGVAVLVVGRTKRSAFSLGGGRRSVGGLGALLRTCNFLTFLILDTVQRPQRATDTSVRLSRTSQEVAVYTNLALGCHRSRNLPNCSALRDVARNDAELQGGKIVSTPLCNQALSCPGIRMQRAVPEGLLSLSFRSSARGRKCPILQVLLSPHYCSPENPAQVNTTSRKCHQIVASAELPCERDAWNQS